MLSIIIIVIVVIIIIVTVRPAMFVMLVLLMIFGMLMKLRMPLAIGMIAIAPIIAVMVNPVIERIMVTGIRTNT